MFHPLVSHSFHALRSLVLHTCRAYDNIRSHERCDTYNVKVSTHESAIKLKFCGTKTKSPWRFRHRLHDHNSIGQSCSAFRTSSMQHFSAVGSAHSFTETVLFFSLTFFGLISPQHSGTPPWKSRQTEVVFVHHSHKDPSDPSRQTHNNVILWRRSKILYMKTAPFVNTFWKIWQNQKILSSHSISDYKQILRRFEINCAEQLVKNKHRANTACNNIRKQFYISRHHMFISFACEHTKI